MTIKKQSREDKKSGAESTEKTKNEDAKKRTEAKTDFSTIDLDKLDSIKRNKNLTRVVEISQNLTDEALSHSQDVMSYNIYKNIIY